MTTDTFMQLTQRTDGVELTRLEPLTTLLVWTQNSLYRLVVAEGCDVLLQGGPFFPELTPARVQGGRPIGGYQAIQHACADLVRDVDAARALLYAAAWKDGEGRDAEADAALAKAYASEACLAVARRGHQILGAISYCEEHPLHLLHKRIQAASLDFGDAQLHLETVARAIGLA